MKSFCIIRIVHVLRMNDFDTKRYQDEVILLKNIPIECCQLIAEGHLRLAPLGDNIILSKGHNIGKIELAINVNGIPTHNEQNGYILNIFIVTIVHATRLFVCGKKIDQEIGSESTTCI